MAAPSLAPRIARGPKISVVMPTFRRAHQIGESVKSLIEGEWSDFELLIRDEGDGKDGTREAIEAVTPNDTRIRYHRNGEKLGMPGNLNAGIADTVGDYVVVCHDHDVYKREFLRRMFEIAERNPTVLFVHSAIDAISQTGQYLATHNGKWPEVTAGSDWLKIMLKSLSCPVCALTLVPRSVHERFGLYDPTFGFISDVEMWMRLSLNGPVGFSAEELIQVRTREPGHITVTNAMGILRTNLLIHRMYLPKAFDGAHYLVRKTRLEYRAIQEKMRILLSSLIRVPNRS